jgi:hypothetical protein
VELLIAQNVNKKDRAWGAPSWFKTHPATIWIRGGRPLAREIAGNPALQRCGLGVSNSQHGVAGKSVGTERSPPRRAENRPVLRGRRNVPNNATFRAEANTDSVDAVVAFKSALIEPAFGHRLVSGPE